MKPATKDFGSFDISLSICFPPINPSAISYEEAAKSLRLVPNIVAVEFNDNASSLVNPTRSLNVVTAPTKSWSATIAAVPNSSFNAAIEACTSLPVTPANPKLPAMWSASIDNPNAESFERSISLANWVNSLSNSNAFASKPTAINKGNNGPNDATKPFPATCPSAKRLTTWCSIFLPMPSRPNAFDINPPPGIDFIQVSISSKGSNSSSYFSVSSAALSVASDNDSKDSCFNFASLTDCSK